jgi:hypothetical protein
MLRSGGQLTATRTEPFAAAPADGDDESTARRRLAAVWLAAGSATAAMVAVAWYIVARNGGQPPGGDMIGHAATARWLRTLPWWDWRGWSDWFYGGQAVGVNYPPLGHALMRFTHPVHSQMAAVAIGLLVLAPWGTLRLARAVGYPPRAQRAAVGAVLVLIPAAATLHLFLAGFQMGNGFFGSWQAMGATTGALFCAAWAARGRRPVTCGAVAGLLVLLNASVMPGAAVVCLALLATSGLPWRRALGWAAAAASATLAVCAWWLVPFVAGWGRFVDWEVSLGDALANTGIVGIALLAAVAVAATWAARHGPPPARRPAFAAAAALAATLVAELLDVPRAQRWLRVAVLVAAAAAAAGPSRPAPPRPPGRPWAALGAALAVAFAVVTRRYEVLPLAVWLLWWPRRTWVTAGAFAWAALLIFVPLGAQVRSPRPAELPGEPLLEATAAAAATATGPVYLDRFFEYPTGELAVCDWSHPWRATVVSGGSIRPLWGVYQETSRAAEFVGAEQALRIGELGAGGLNRPHWFEAWLEAGSVSLDSPGTARLLGAGWYGACDPAGAVTVEAVGGIDAAGVTVSTHATEDAWHEAAVHWWVPLAAGAAGEGAARTGVPILSGGEAADHPAGQAAAGVSLRRGGDTLTVEAASPGWAWIRVPWDPDWRSLDGAPVRLGGPGHLVVWADRGTTELRWGVTRATDVAAVATTAAATLATAAAALAWRRRDPTTAPRHGSPDAPAPAAKPTTSPRTAAPRRGSPDAPAPALTPTTTPRAAAPRPGDPDAPAPEAGSARS